MYENIDNFLDSAQKLDITSKNTTNLQGTYTMREPLNFVRYVEAILGEINSRMQDKSKDIPDSFVYMICKSISSKKFLLDKCQP